MKTFRTMAPAALGALVAVLVLAGAPAPAQAVDYSVKELLDSCLEGDNASREHETIEALICNQYLRGFEDAYVVIGGKGYCFPSGPDRVADARRMFIKWGVNNTKAHGWAAADGVLAAMGCK